MKQKTITTLLTAAILLIAVVMTGCTKLSEAKSDPSAALDTPGKSVGAGVYVKLERDDVHSIALHGGSFTKVCQNADGSLLKAGECFFTGDDIVQLSKEVGHSVPFTICVRNAEDTLLGEGTFLYDTVQEKLYVTIGAAGMTCTTSNTPAENVRAAS